MRIVEFDLDHWELPVVASFSAPGDIAPYVRESVHALHMCGVAPQLPWLDEVEARATTAAAGTHNDLDQVIPLKLGELAWLRMARAIEMMAGFNKPLEGLVLLQFGRAHVEASAWLTLIEPLEPEPAVVVKQWLKDQVASLRGSREELVRVVAHNVAVEMLVDERALEPVALRMHRPCVSGQHCVCDTDAAEAIDEARDQMLKSSPVLVVDKRQCGISGYVSAHGEVIASRRHQPTFGAAAISMLYPSLPGEVTELPLGFARVLEAADDAVVLGQREHGDDDQVVELARQLGLSGTVGGTALTVARAILR